MKQISKINNKNISIIVAINESEKRVSADCFKKKMFKNSTHKIYTNTQSKILLDTTHK